jgi:hypothetical protein
VRPLFIAAWAVSMKSGWRSAGLGTADEIAAWRCCEEWVAIGRARNGRLKRGSPPGDVEEWVAVGRARNGGRHTDEEWAESPTRDIEEWVGV